MAMRLLVSKRYQTSRSGERCSCDMGDQTCTTAAYLSAGLIGR
jgi:hypothetical protein